MNEKQKAVVLAFMAWPAAYMNTSLPEWKDMVDTGGCYPGYETNDRGCGPRKLWAPWDGRSVNGRYLTALD